MLRTFHNSPDMDSAEQRHQCYEPSTTTLALPSTQYASGPSKEHSSSSDMDSAIVTNVLPGKPPTKALALPPTQHASGLATEHSTNSDMSSEIVFSVIHGDEQQKIMVIHCDDETNEIYSYAQTDFETINGYKIAELDTHVTQASFGKRKKSRRIAS